MRTHSQSEFISDKFKEGSPLLEHRWSDPVAEAQSFSRLGLFVCLFLIVGGLGVFLREEEFKKKMEEWVGTRTS